MRKTLIAGNWKMNGDKAMAAVLCREIVSGSENITDVDVLMCPPFTLLPVVESVIRETSCFLGAQDMDVNDNGAFTGQISSSMLADCGCSHVILGHSERRTIYGESNELVAAKADKAIADGLIPVLCVGETRAEREAGMTDKVVSDQVRAVIEKVGVRQFRRIVIAYEPVWAIGTGLTAAPEQAQAVHHAIRRQLAALDQAAAGQCRILYGGSMKPENAAELLAGDDIDGGLIGGAALKAGDFLEICKAA